MDALYQLSYRGSSAGLVESRDVKCKATKPDTQVNSNLVLVEMAKVLEPAMTPKSMHVYMYNACESNLFSYAHFLMRDERRKKEASKVKQTTMQSNTSTPEK